MRVLLDECVPEPFRHLIVGHSVETARFAGLAGLSNGRLLSAMAGRFEVLVTVDTNVPYQNQIASRPLAVILLRGVSNALEHLVPALLTELGQITPGTYKEIH
jgi:hypothetical protein